MLSFSGLHCRTSSPTVILSYILRESGCIFDTLPSDLMIDFLILKINSLNVLGYAEGDGQTFASQILGQFIKNFKIEVQFFILLPCDKCWVKFNWEHVETAFKFILHCDGLSKWRYEFKLSHLRKRVKINCLVNLGNSNFLPISYCILLELILGHQTLSHPLTIYLHHSIIYYIE